MCLVSISIRIVLVARASSTSTRSRSHRHHHHHQHSIVSVTFLYHAEHRHRHVIAAVVCINAVRSSDLSSRHRQLVCRLRRHHCIIDAVVIPFDIFLNVGVIGSHSVARSFVIATHSEAFLQTRVIFFCRSMASAFARANLLVKLPLSRACGGQSTFACVRLGALWAKSS